MPTNIAQQIHRHEEDARDREGEERSRAAGERESDGRGEEPADEIAKIPDEEGERDEGCGLEEGWSGVVSFVGVDIIGVVVMIGWGGARHAENFLREDGKDHCDGKGEEDGACVPA